MKRFLTKGLEKKTNQSVSIILKIERTNKQIIWKDEQQTDRYMAGIYKNVDINLECSELPCKAIMCSEPNIGTMSLRDLKFVTSEILFL